MTRESIVEGIFYPADKEKLENEIKTLLEASETRAATASGILVPHAGYRYTGRTAAAAFKACSGFRPACTVIMAPVTRDASDGIFLSGYTEFETPLGSIRVNEEASSRLLACKGRFAKDDHIFTEEHSIEVQLPFIQYLFPETEILPIHLGRQNAGTVRQLIKGLSALFGNRNDILYIVSGNLSSYLPFNAAEEQAESFIKTTSENSHEEMLLRLQEKHILPSCTGCVTAAMAMCGSRISILDMGNSGEEKTVFYASAVIG